MGSGRVGAAIGRACDRGIAALRRIKSGDLTWPAFFVLVVLLSLLNLKTGSALLSERLAPFSGIAIVMTIASRQPGAALVRTLCLAAIAGLIGQTEIRSVAYKSWAPTLESELAAGRANPGKTFANADMIALPTANCSPGACGRRCMPRRPRRSRPRRRVVVAATLDAIFRLLPAAICRGARFHARGADWVDDPDAASVAKFRNANQGAPQILIVSSSDRERTGARRQTRLWRLQSRVTRGLREISVCKVSRR